MSESAAAPGAAVAVPFPSEPPPGFEVLDDEPVFDPERHLALTEPDHVVTLADLGYSADEISDTATDMAISAPFRILSDEGAEVMLELARRLRAFVRPAGDRIEHTVRGGCHRSRWFADLCISPEVTAHLARIYGTTIAPHPMVMHLGHLNYEPSTIDTAVDKWHHDTLPLDYVMAVTDPRQTPGGRFEYFVGTKADADALRRDGRTPPPERVVGPDLPGPGWAVAMHGNMVVHRGGPLTEHAERITMVNGYVATDPSLDEQSRTADLIGVDPAPTLYGDWARFVAWRAQGRLRALGDEIGFNDDPELVASALDAAIEEVRRAAEEMRAGPRTAAHYEDASPD